MFGGRDDDLYDFVPDMDFDGDHDFVDYLIFEEILEEERKKNEDPDSEDENEGEDFYIRDDFDDENSDDEDFIEDESDDEDSDLVTFKNTTSNLDYYQNDEMSDDENDSDEYEDVEAYAEENENSLDADDYDEDACDESDDEESEVITDDPDDEQDYYPSDDISEYENTTDEYEDIETEQNDVGTEDNGLKNKNQAAGHTDDRNDTKYEWRRYCFNRFGVKPQEYETRDAYDRAVSKAAKKEHELRIRRTLSDQDNTKKYRFCKVSLDYPQKPHLYYFPGDIYLSVGDHVVVPLGDNNEERDGVVTAVGECLGLAFPCPVSMVKYVLRKKKTSC